jgi:hypothetical protein
MGASMGLGERCDEIVRLIDETLAACGADPADSTPAVPAVPAVTATVTPFPASAPRPERAASGF